MRKFIDIFEADEKVFNSLSDHIGDSEKTSIHKALDNSLIQLKYVLRMLEKANRVRTERVGWKNDDDQLLIEEVKRAIIAVRNIRGPTV